MATNDTTSTSKGGGFLDWDAWYRPPADTSTPAATITTPTVSMATDPALNVQAGPQRGSTSISITPPATQMWNDSVERAAQLDAGPPVTGTKSVVAPSGLSSIPWWVWIAGGVVFFLSSRE